MNKTTFKDGTIRHSEGATATEESTNGKVCVNSQMDTSCEFMDSSLSTKAQNDGVSRHCEVSALTTRHSEGATATEESIAKSKGVNSQGDTSCEFMDSSLSTKAQNDGVVEFKDGISRHSERNEVERRIHNELKFKHSGVEWLGEIPKHWEVRRLRFLGQIFAGLVNKQGKDFDKDYSEGTQPYIPFTNIARNFIIDENQMEFVKIGYDELQNEVKENDILFLMSSETCEEVGKNALYKGKKKVYLNSFCKGFRIANFEILNPIFLNYLWSSLSYQRYFMMFGRGFTRINLRQEYVLDLPVLLPPIDEQEKIAEFLDNKCEKIAEFIAKKQRLIALLKEQKRSLINECVCGRLEFMDSSLRATHSAQNDGVETYNNEVVEFKDGTIRHSEGATATEESTNSKACVNLNVDSSLRATHSAQNDGVETYNDEVVEFKHSGVEWLGEIPKHWEVVSLNKIGESFIGLAYTLENVSADLEGIPVLRSNNIKDGKMNYENLVYVKNISIPKRCLTRKDDLLICANNGSANLVGKTALIDKENMSFGAFMIIYRSKYNKFIYYILQTDFLRSSIYGFSSSTGINQITKNDISSFKIPLPPKKEQEKIAEFLDNKCEKIDKAIELIQTQINAMKEYKTSLIDKAVRGVCDL